jgi:hypothetical protein
MAVFGDKQLTSIGFSQLDKELVVRYISFWFKPVMLA